MPVVVRVTIRLLILSLTLCACWALADRPAVCLFIFFGVPFLPKQKNTYIDKGQA